MLTQLGQLAFDSEQLGVRNIFATPIIVAQVQEPEALNQALTAAILLHRQSQPGVERSNAGGWQSDGDFVSWSGDAGRQLQDLVTSLANAMTGIQTDDGLERQPPVWKINSWANVNERGDSNRLHHHPTSFWSAIYWVAVGPLNTGGELEIVDPRGVLPGFYAPRLKMMVPGCLSAGGSDFITPEAGTVILFPAWLQHAVRPHLGDEPRISVAFNFSV